MMSLGYVSFVKYFIIAPNIDQNTGLGFTLHVYGSLIFFCFNHSFIFYKKWIVENYLRFHL
jgi:hypothetical protein